MPCYLWWFWNLSTNFLICLSLKGGASLPSFWVWAEFSNTLPTNRIRKSTCVTYGNKRHCFLLALSGIPHLGKAGCHLARAPKRHSGGDLEVSHSHCHGSEPSGGRSSNSSLIRWLWLLLTPWWQPHERPWARTTQTSTPKFLIQRNCEIINVCI